MWLMSSTFDTSHVDRLPSNDHAPTKRELMSVTPDTSHFMIGPCGPPKQLRSRDNGRQAVTALLSSVLDCGENKNSPAQEFGEMDITRAKKIIWWYGSEGIVTFYSITCSLFLRMAPCPYCTLYVGACDSACNGAYLPAWTDSTLK